MVYYITFCMMTPGFLQLSLEDRNNIKSEIAEEAQKYGIRVVFSGMPLGVNEHLVFVFHLEGNSDKFFMFQRDILKLGTSDAAKYFQNTRSLPVY